MQLLDPLPLGARTRSATACCSDRTRPTSGAARALSDRHVAYYRRRAAGGAGIIVVEEASRPRARLALRAVPAGDGVRRRVGARSRRRLPRRGRARARRARPRRRPGIVGVQPARAVGAVARARGQHPRGAEGRWRTTTSTRSSPASRAATRLAVDAGCDGVEVNAGQHSLVRQFLSGLTNQRDDEYGTDRLALRPRGARAPCGAAAGDGAVVGLRLSCDELAPWAGIMPEAARAASPPRSPPARSTTSSWSAASIFSVAATRPDGHDAAGVQPRAVPDRSARAVGGARAGGRRRARSSTSGQAEWARRRRRLRRRRDDPGADRRPRPRPASWRPAGPSGPAVHPAATRRARCATPRNPIVSCVVEPSSRARDARTRPRRPRRRRSRATSLRRRRRRRRAGVRAGRRAPGPSR